MASSEAGIQDRVGVCGYWIGQIKSGYTELRTRNYPILDGRVVQKPQSALDAAKQPA